MDCRLVDVSSGNREMYVLRDGVTTLGRDTDNVIQLHSPNVSRHHAEITNLSAVCQIKDLNSYNGTYINGQRITTAVIRNGTEIKFADQVFLLEEIGSAGSDDTSMSNRSYSRNILSSTMRLDIPSILGDPQPTTRATKTFKPTLPPLKPLKPKT